MTESTSEYKKRIEEIKQSIESEPYMAKMREDIAEGISKTGIRQATVEEQFQTVLDETTGKDVISAPELIAARNGELNLKTRLDKEKQEVTAQLAQTATKEEVAHIVYDVKSLDGIDDVAINRALNNMESGGTLLFSDDVFFVDNDIEKTISQKTTLKFNNSSIKIADGKKLKLTSPKVVETTLANNAYLYDNSVVVKSAFNVESGDIIYIKNDTISESGWSTKKMFTSTVRSVNGGIIGLNNKLHFDFLLTEPGNVVEIYKPVELNFEDLSLTTSTETMSTQIDLTGFIVNMKNVNQNNTANAYAIHLNKCVNSMIETVYVKGGTYPFLVNTCRNIRFKNLNNVGGAIRHMVSSASWSADIFIDGLHGPGSLIESHPSFNVNYKNCDITCTSDFLWNLRSVGGSIENAKIKGSGVINSSPQVQSLFLEDTRLWEKSTFVMKNVILDDVGTGGTFTIGGSKNIYIENCEFPEGTVLRIGVGSNSPGIENLHLKNTKGIKHIMCRSSKLNVYTDKTEENAELNSGYYEVDSLFNTVIRDGSGNAHWENNGSIVNRIEKSTGTPLVIPMKVFTQNKESETLYNFRRTFMTIKLTAILEHNNTGTYDIQENTYHAMVQNISTSSATIAEIPAFSSVNTGITNEDLDISIGNVAVNAESQNASLGVDHYFTFDITLNSARSSPKYSLYYEIKYMGMAN